MGQLFPDGLAFQDFGGGNLVQFGQLGCRLFESLPTESMPVFAAAQPAS